MSCQNDVGGPALAAFSTALDAYPARYQGNPLNLLYVPDAAPIESPHLFLRELDGPFLTDERRQYARTEGTRWPFPSFTVATRPNPWDLSHRLFDGFETAAALMTTQSELGRLVEERARRQRPDIVLLVVVDGLSYYDLPEDYAAEPCLVDGVSITGHGFLRVLGKPEIARLMFALGYTDQVGYTFHLPDANPLAEAIFGLFSRSQVRHVRTTAEMVKDMATLRVRKGYLQVSVPGLDHLAHAHPDRPPTDRYLAETLNRFDNLVEALSRRRRKVLACMVADHGVLWRDCFEKQAEIVGDLMPEDSRSPRFVRGHFMRAYSRPVTSLGEKFTLLRFPYLNRRLRNNEWGVHGGISAWESIVPLVIRTT